MRQDRQLRACAPLSLLAVLAALAAAPALCGEEELTGWQGGQRETTLTRGGRDAVRWELDKSPAIFINFDPPADWSDVGALRFWMYSEKDTGARFTLVVDSDNPQRDKKGVDYFHYPDNIVQDWTGWREFSIPVRHMRPSSTPVGWRQVDRVAFQRVSPAGGALVLDGFRPVKGRSGMTAEDREVFQRHPLRAHPRLLLVAGDDARLKDAAARDPLLRDLISVLTAQADVMLADPPLEHGAGWKALPRGNLCQLRVHTLALAFRLTGKKAYADRAIKEMLAAAALRDWSKNFLEIANLTCALAVGYDWLYADLDAKEKETIRAAIVRNGLRPGIAAYEGPEWWVHTDWNWNHVCNGGLILGALAVAEDEPELAAEVLYRARWCLRKGLSGYYPDGAWSEGPDYHRYATTYAALALAGLQSALGTDFDLSAATGLAETGLYRIHAVSAAGRYFNYGDCWWAFPAASPDMFWLARRFDRPLCAWWQREALRGFLERWQKNNPECMMDQHRFFPLALALYDGRGGAADLAALPLDKWFRGHALVCMRSAWQDPNALCVGFKGGTNANVSHGHLDAGSFVLESDGVRWAVDMGPEDYEAPGYFEIGDGARRWSHYLAHSRSHNTLVIDGQIQRYSGGGDVTAFVSTPENARAVMDLSSAYRGQAERVIRGIAMLDRSRVLVSDELRGVKPPHVRANKDAASLRAPGVEVRWAMVTQAAVEIKERTATLTQTGRTLRTEILEPADARFELLPIEPVRRETVMSKGARMLVIRLPAPADAPLRLSVLFTPVGPRWPVLPPPLVRPPSEWDKDPAIQ